MSANTSEIHASFVPCLYRAIWVYFTDLEYLDQLLYYGQQQWKKQETILVVCGYNKINLYEAMKLHRSWINFRVLVGI